MKDVARYAFGILKQTVNYWLEGHAVSYAGALAFFTLFSMAPVVILAVKVISLVMSSDAAMAQIMSQLQDTIGADAADQVRSAVANSQFNDTGLFASLMSLALIIVGATTVFAQMQRSLNTIWEVAPRPSRNTIVALVKSRLLSLTIVLSLGFVLMVSLLLSVAVSAVLEYARSWLPIPGELVMVTELMISVLVIALLFATMFRLLPDVVLRWKDVLPGAVVTAGLFVIGRALIALYLAHTATASTYGAAGSLVVLLLWVYYSSLILLFGAAFTRAHTEARGIKVKARSTAVRIKRQHVDA
ncbi:ribonuclease BN family protein [Alcanivorax hongdengensis A-11-3]|uniref:Ribonuclease BN family protein n=1 Tax=Alcanivorax hongdengensis A-11-3 TaxID=1177179 RepID=L0WCP4_9GAMM|nr:YhjD/YihY/BrkB family envelope integrity protein [Alcanivorax hongdengensis]EKF74726.1 ribonuclease BN family protein [Alcanivorax hongdengensis A-11-3]